MPVEGQALYTRKKAFVLFSIVTTALVIDMLISSFSDVFLPEVHSSTQNVTGLIVSFIVLAIIIYGGGQLLLNGFVKRVSTELRNKKRDIGLMYKVLIIIQYIIVSIISVIILQIIFLHQYSTSHHFGYYCKLCTSKRNSGNSKL